MTLAWTPDQSTMLIFAFIVIALLALGMILMFVHFHGGIKAVNTRLLDKTDNLLHLHANALPPVVNVQPTIHVDQAQLDAAVEKALTARANAPSAALADMAAGPVKDVHTEAGWTYATPGAPAHPWDKKS